MSFAVRFLDCCDDPMLEVSRRITVDDHDRQHLCRCERCGSYWFDRFSERIHFDADLPDDQTTWYVRLSEAEALYILGSPSRPALPFLAGRRCFREDERGVSPDAVYPPF